MFICIIKQIPAEELSGFYFVSMSKSFSIMFALTLNILFFCQRQGFSTTVLKDSVRELRYKIDIFIWVLAH